jgi:hypothetical protein
MAAVSRNRDRAQLEHELQTDEYEELLRGIQRNEPFLLQFTTWADVLAFMRSGTSTDPRKDEVLRPIFQAHGEDQDPRWRAILLAIFWPGLESMYFRKRHWDADSDERWQTIQWTFLQVLCRVDVKRRPERLVQKVINDTIHHFHDECRRGWKHVNHEIATDAEMIEALAGGVDGIDFEALDLREAHEREINRLREHLDAGRITEADFLLLVGTRLYGQSVADYARGVGLDYQVAKKRRQRAEAAIRRHEKEKQ